MVAAFEPARANSLAARPPGAGPTAGARRALRRRHRLTRIACGAPAASLEDGVTRSSYTDGTRVSGAPLYPLEPRDRTPPR
jgi:hypothetical protein